MDNTMNALIDSLDKCSNLLNIAWVMIEKNPLLLLLAFISLFVLGRTDFLLFTVIVVLVCITYLQLIKIPRKDLKRLGVKKANRILNKHNLNS